MIVTKNDNFGRLYNRGFKRRVLLEIESGLLSAEGARLKYGIGGKMTVYKWLTNREELLGKEEEMGEEKEQGEESKEKSKEALELRVRELEKQYEESEQKRVAYEKMIEIAERELRISIRKKSGAKQSKS